MSNIWEFLLQTTEVTLTAGILLLLKWMFQDKLSPRWQYGVWLLLAGKLLLPAGLRGKYISLNLAATIDLWKYQVERELESVFVQAYTAVRPSVGVPVQFGMPVSITDWLYMLYFTGVILFIVYYLGGYFSLRRILRKGWEADSITLEKLSAVCEKYQLKSCRVRIIDGIESAFVCGFFNCFDFQHKIITELIYCVCRLFKTVNRKFSHIINNSFTSFHCN